MFLHSGRHAPCCVVTNVSKNVKFMFAILFSFLFVTVDRNLIFFSSRAFKHNFLFPDNFPIQVAVPIHPTVSTGLGWSATCSAAISYWGGFKIFRSLWSSLRCELCGPGYKQYHNVSFNICQDSMTVCFMYSKSPHMLQSQCTLLHKMSEYFSSQYHSMFCINLHVLLYIRFQSTELLILSQTVL
jgi:hypothetical protein